MQATSKLHDLGQSLWLDNITRDLLSSGTLQRYIDAFAVTGLTSNPTIFDHAVRNSTAYDDEISRAAASARSKEDLFFTLALADLTRAAELFGPIHARTDGVDGRPRPAPAVGHNTMPEATLKAFGEHGRVAEPLSSDGGDCEEVLAEFAKAGVDTGSLAGRLQDEGAVSFVKSWNDLMDRVDAKSAAIRKAS